MENHQCNMNGLMEPILKDLIMLVLFFWNLDQEDTSWDLKSKH